MHQASTKLDDCLTLQLWGLESAIMGLCHVQETKLPASVMDSPELHQDKFILMLDEATTHL